MRLFFSIYLKEEEKIPSKKKNFGTYDNTIGYNNEERRPYNTYITHTEMQDYNDNDYDNEDEEDLFGTHRQEEVDKQMFLQDCARGFPLVLDPMEYETLFGPLREEDTEELTQVFFSQYHRLGVKVDTLVDSWGLDWIWCILKSCERSEEYELCGIIVNIIEEYSNPHLNKLLSGKTTEESIKVKPLI